MLKGGQTSVPCLLLLCGCICMTVCIYVAEEGNVEGIYEQVRPQGYKKVRTSPVGG